MKPSNLYSLLAPWLLQRCGFDNAVALLAEKQLAIIADLAIGNQNQSRSAISPAKAVQIQC